MDEQLCSKFSLAIEGLAMHLDSCRVVYAPNNAQERTPKRQRSYSDWLSCKKTKGQTEVKRECMVPFIKLHSLVKERGSYTAFRFYSVDLGYVMIPGYFVAKL